MSLHGQGGEAVDIRLPVGGLVVGHRLGHGLLRLAEIVADGGQVQPGGGQLVRRAVPRLQDAQGLPERSQGLFPLVTRPVEEAVVVVDRRQGQVLRRQQGQIQGLRAAEQVFRFFDPPHDAEAGGGVQQGGRLLQGPPQLQHVQAAQGLQIVALQLLKNAVFPAVADEGVGHRQTHGGVPPLQGLVLLLVEEAEGAGDVPRLVEFIQPPVEFLCIHAFPSLALFFLLYFSPGPLSTGILPQKMPPGLPEKCPCTYIDKPKPVML